MSDFMQPFTYHGAYYLVDTLDGGIFLVQACDVGPNPTGAAMADFQPEGITSSNDPSDWEVTLHQGWYGRLTAPGYMDCTDWEWADTEEELMASLTDGMDDESDNESDDDESAIPEGRDAIEPHED